MPINENLFSVNNQLHSGFTYDDLITAVISNEKEINEQTITKVYRELQLAARIDANELLKLHMNKII